MVSKKLKLLAGFTTIAILFYSVFLTSPSVSLAALALPSHQSLSHIHHADYASDQVIVRYKKSKEHISVVKVDTGKSVEDTVRNLQSDPNVEYAEPDYVRDVATISTNDTDKDLLWALDNTGQEINGDWDDITGTAGADMNAPEAWSISEGNSNPPIVAVIDIGVLYTHPDLAANMWDGTNCKDNTGAALGGCNHGYDYQSNDKSPLPSSSDFHGTHVSGIIGAVKNNNLGVVGIAPHAQIMAVRFSLTVSSEVKAIDFATQNGAKIINASFGGAGFSQAEYDAISRFKDAGGLFVAAAGNGGCDELGDDNDGTHIDCNTDLPVSPSHNYPSDYDLPNILSVAATDQNDLITEFSNFGTTSIDVGAPGENILSTVLSNGYGYASGTSMATPYTAGLAALIWGYNNNLSYTDIKNIILNSGDANTSLAGKTVSGKRVNAQKSLFDADIFSAQSLHDGAVEGTDPNQYEVGSKATFQTAIDTANAVLTNVTSTSVDIAQGVTDLNTATATFSGAQNPPPSDLSTLTSAITSAQTLHDGAVEGTLPGQYAVDSKATLQTAIDTAGGITDSDSQGTVDAAVTTLNDAVTAFQSGMVDNIPPVISRIGSSSVNVKFDATYTDAGATASDNKHGDITADIITVNPVNTHVAATYHVTYNVSDAEGNTATQVTRTVIVKKKSTGGGGGGGGGAPRPSTTPAVTTPTVIPSDCQVGFAFSPSTGSPCTTGNPNDPARYLLNQNSTSSTSNLTCTIFSVLKVGSRGDEVKCLQSHLNILADGSFGPHTKASVIIFQQAHGLTPDGVVGPKTVSAL